MISLFVVIGFFTFEILDKLMNMIGIAHSHGEIDDSGMHDHHENETVTVWNRFWIGWNYHKLFNQISD